MKHAFAATAALLVVATPAAAQEAEPAFSGLYVGAAGGYDVQPNDRGSSIRFDRNLDGRFDNTVLTPTGANAFGPGFCSGSAVNTAAGTPTAGRGPQNGGLGCTKDGDGAAYYGRVGLDAQRGGLVLGVVGEFGKTEINDSVTGFSSTPANYVMYREIAWEAGIRARAGYTPNNATLFYGTFGPGYAKINSEFASSQSTNRFTARGDERQFGIQGGGGIEQKIGRNFSIGLEYLYHQYLDNDYRVRTDSATGATTPFTNAGNGGTVQGTDFRRSDPYFRWHSIRGTASFRF